MLLSLLLFLMGKLKIHASSFRTRLYRSGRTIEFAIIICGRLKSYHGSPLHTLTNSSVKAIHPRMRNSISEVPHTGFNLNPNKFFKKSRVNISKSLLVFQYPSRVSLRFALLYRLTFIKLFLTAYDSKRNLQFWPLTIYR